MIVLAHFSLKNCKKKIRSGMEITIIISISLGLSGGESVYIMR